MTRDQYPAAVLLAVSLMLVTAGVGVWSIAAAFITGGVLLGVWTVLLVVPVPRRGDRR